MTHFNILLLHHNIILPSVSFSNPLAPSQQEHIFCKHKLALVGWDLQTWPCHGKTDTGHSPQQLDNLHILHILSVFSPSVINHQQKN